MIRRLAIVLAALPLGCHSARDPSPRAERETWTALPPEAAWAELPAAPADEAAASVPSDDHALLILVIAAIVAVVAIVAITALALRRRD